MRKEAIQLGLIAALLITQGACLVLLLRRSAAAAAPAATPADVERPRAPTGTSTPIPAPAHAVLDDRMTAIEAHLAQLSRDVRTLAERSSEPSPAPEARSVDAHPRGDAPGEIVEAEKSGSASKVDRLLAANRRVKEFWNDLSGLAQIRQSVPESEYLDVLLQGTSELLHLDGDRRAQCEELLRRKLTEYDTLQSDMQQTVRERFPKTAFSDNKADSQRVMEDYKGFMGRHATALQRVFEETRSGLTRILDGEDYTHRSFLGQVEIWFKTAGGQGQRTWVEGK